MPGMYRNRVTDRPGSGRLSFQRVVQLLSAALVNGYLLGFQKGTIFTGGTKAICVPVLHCYSCPGALGACPVGALQAAVGGVRGHFPFYVLGLLMLFGVVLGRVVCGLLCPFGLVQDLLYKLPLPKRSLPGKLDRPARAVKYGVLLLLFLPALVPAGAASPYFCKYLCPAGTLGGGIPLLLADPALRKLAGGLFQWKVLVLVVLLAASALTRRPFCRYLCPLGAFYSLFNRFSLFQMYLDPAKCTGCQACERSCPMAVAVRKHINSPECIRCGTCRAICPTGAITSGFVCGAQTKPPQKRDTGGHTGTAESQ